MILLTGAAGFIGSCVLSDLVAKQKSVIVVDDFSAVAKKKNWIHKNFEKKIDRKELYTSIDFLSSYPISAIIHLGARTDTTCADESLLEYLNVHYSQKLWHYATERQIPFLYASSAATYGDGNLGFKDEHGIIPSLRPLNLYGKSKNDFDKWALQQEKTPPSWYGFKFFNVYGANEYHKGRMASVIWHTYQQIQKTGVMRLFRSHRADYKDGEQSRDFIYVKDVSRTLVHFLESDSVQNGIYNLGTGKARTFYDLAASVFSSLGMTPNISYIDTPIDIRDKYQYFTEADMNKMTSQFKGVSSFYSLEEGIKDYVQQYLMTKSYY